MSRTRQLALFGVTAVVLASTPLATKLSIGPDGFTRTVAAPLRASIACIACLLVVCIPPIRRKQGNFFVKSELPWLLGVGVTNGVAFFLTYFALSRTPSVMLTLTGATQPFMVSFLMRRTKMEHVTTASICGCAIAFAGITILTLHESRSQNIGVLPVLALLLAAVVVSSSSVMLKMVKTTSKLGSQLIIYAGSACILWCGYLAAEGQNLALPHPTTTAILALLYSALVGSLLGFILYLSVFRMTGAVTASSFALVQPPIAFVISLCLCMEPTVATPGMVAAFPFILVGVGLNWRAVYLEQRREAAQGKEQTLDNEPDDDEQSH